METVAERENLKKALARVKHNPNAAGVDGMSVNDLPAYLKTIGSRSGQLHKGKQPAPGVEMPKAFTLEN